MCEKKTKLPLLPGFSFKDCNKVDYHRSQCFDIKSGAPNSKDNFLSSGRSPRDVDSIQYYDWEGGDLRLDPRLIYGEPRVKNVRPFRPHNLIQDRSALCFKGYFCQKAYNTADESHRIRVVNVLYFLEDDTITVIEPVTINSGLPQGRLVRRSRIPTSPPPDCEYLHWKDLNMGEEYRICGFLIRLIDCDEYTKEFLCSQGIVLNPSEELPVDDLTRKKQQNDCHRQQTSNPDLKLKKFLLFDKMVLKFRAIWNSDEGSNAYCISYFLEDDTMQVGEIHEKNKGREPYAILLRRSKVPKLWHKVEMTYPSLNEQVVQEVTDFYKPTDFLVGKTISIYGRDMFLHECDDYTRKFYCKHFNIAQPDNIDVTPVPPKPIPRPLPPYTGFGDLEDSLQSCLTFAMKSPRKDAIRNIVNANHYLRYKATLCSTFPEDEHREFILSYCLADGTIKITEPPQKNSGHIGGKFLAKMRVPKPGSSRDYPEYYTPHDFAIGSIVTVNDFRFRISGVDLHVYNYMNDNLEKFRPEVVESVRKYVMEKGLLPVNNETSECNNACNVTKAEP